MNDEATLRMAVGRYRGLLIATNAFGAALVVAGWWVASRQLVVSDQIVGANLAAGGVALGFATECIGLFRMRRAVLTREIDLADAQQRAVAKR